MNIQENVLSHTFRRNELAEILDRYNQSIGNDELARSNILRLKESNSVCVFTGQQLGFMGGAAYTLYKALGCLQVAKDLNAIPIFWLATEDHDLAEIDHTYTVSEHGNIQKHKLTLPSEGVVEDLCLTEENIEEIGVFYQQTNSTLPVTKITPGASYAKVMAEILVEKFKGTGLVLMEPRLVRHHAEELFTREVSDQQKISTLLQQTSQNLQERGMSTPIEFRRNGSNLFFKDQKGKRQRVDRIDHEFAVGEKRFSERELIELIRQSPSSFSGNVAMRPIIQSYLFPTVAYIAGPTEVEYFRQLEDYFFYYQLPMPNIIPRPSITCINKACLKYLELAKLQPSDDIPKDWAVVFPELTGRDKKEVKTSLQNMNIPYHALHYLQNFLHPFNSLQERSINWFWLDTEVEKPIVQMLLNNPCLNEKNHQYLKLIESIK